MIQSQGENTGAMQMIDVLLPTSDGRHGSQRKELILSALEFIRRFSLHIWRQFNPVFQSCWLGNLRIQIAPCPFLRPIAHGAFPRR
jgi:hypothetical protein